MPPRKTRERETEDETRKRIEENVRLMSPLLKQMTECLWCATEIEPPYTPYPPPCKNCGGSNE